MHNKTIIEFGFHMLAIIIKASVCVIRLSLRLRQITQTLALIIIANMLNLIQSIVNSQPNVSVAIDTRVVEYKSPQKTIPSLGG